MQVKYALLRLFQLLLCLGALTGNVPEAVAQGAEGIRPELGKTLLLIQDLLKTGQHKEALARIAEADASTGKTPYELFILDRLRGAAAAGAGEIDVAVRSFEAVLASGRLPAAEQATILEALVGSYYRAKNYPQTIAAAQRYFQQGGSNPKIRSAVIQARYASGDFATAATELTADLDADEQAGRKPEEAQLQLLASCHLQLKNQTGYANALERLVAHFPKPQHWLELAIRLQKQPGFAERLTLDVLRLQRATGALTDADDYAYLGQLALQAGLPAEAVAVLEEGFAKGVLGQGSDGSKQKQLRDLANRQALADAKQQTGNQGKDSHRNESNTMFADGHALATAGQAELGLAMMEQAVAKGGLKRPADAWLHLGETYLAAGKKDLARTAFDKADGPEGLRDLARLWSILTRP
ncbi:MAG: tetratricopeptide repeat protein [Proteobacteria bacterium]|nr:tetratricopeptide repeat protein [Pseudomonadota bacterium]